MVGMGDRCGSGSEGLSSFSHMASDGGAQDARGRVSVCSGANIRRGIVGTGDMRRAGAGVPGDPTSLPSASAHVPGNPLAFAGALTPRLPAAVLTHCLLPLLRGTRDHGALATAGRMDRLFVNDGGDLAAVVAWERFLKRRARLATVAELMGRACLLLLPLACLASTVLGGLALHGALPFVSIMFPLVAWYAVWVMCAGPLLWCVMAHGDEPVVGHPLLWQWWQLEAARTRFLAARARGTSGLDLPPLWVGFAVLHCGYPYTVRRTTWTLSSR